MSSHKQGLLFRNYRRRKMHTDFQKVKTIKFRWIIQRNGLFKESRYKKRLRAFANNDRDKFPEFQWLKIGQHTAVTQYLELDLSHFHLSPSGNSRQNISNTTFEFAFAVAFKLEHGPAIKLALASVRSIGSEANEFSFAQVYLGGKNSAVQFIIIALVGCERQTRVWCNHASRQTSFSVSPSKLCPVN